MSRHLKEKNSESAAKTAQFPHENNVTLFCSGRARARVLEWDRNRRPFFNMAAPMDGRESCPSQTKKGGVRD